MHVAGGYPLGQLQTGDSNADRELTYQNKLTERWRWGNCVYKVTHNTLVTCPTAVSLLFLSSSALILVSPPPSCSLYLRGKANSTSGLKSLDVS